MRIDPHVRDEIYSIAETRGVEGDPRGNIEKQRLALAVFFALLFAAMLAAGIGEATAAAAYDVEAVSLNWW